MEKITGRKFAFTMQNFAGFIFLLGFIFLSKTGTSQDVILLRNGKQIECTITKTDNSTIYYDFIKDGRKLSSFVNMSEVRSYTIQDEKDRSENNFSNSENQGNTVVIDTTKYEKIVQQWVNRITFSRLFGIHATGWSLQYYGFTLNSNSKWIVPVVIGFEGINMNQDYFDQSGYYSAMFSYASTGISPMYKLSDSFFLNLGVNLLFGQESLTEFGGTETDRFIIGINPLQGILFIPKSKFGITFGASIYEKLLTSRIYENDLGLKLKLGIKF